jgi:hypothetical protein
MNPSTRRTLIFLGIVAAVLIVLFFVSAMHTPGRGGCATSDLEAWRARVLSPEPVAPGQLSGCTTVLRQTFTIPGSCTLQVARADERSRQLVVSAVEPLTLGFVTDADGRSLDINADVVPGKPRQLFIGKDGQTFTLVCKNGSPCHARLE